LTLTCPFRECDEEFSETDELETHMQEEHFSKAPKLREEV
jgi:hypothetical protein